MVLHYYSFKFTFFESESAIARLFEDSSSKRKHPRKEVLV